MCSSRSIVSFRLSKTLTKFKIPGLLLRSRTNRLEDIRPLVPELLKTVDDATAGTLTTVGK